ncbi:MAG: tetratricopeptide repeat protein [Bacteroidetes bacterium]|nr:tetratricopeptide repeat protein [Bacteroidota bacterium]
MKTNRKIILITIGILILIAVITGCKSRSYDNFTTYFNTFYNEERLMKECEEEFEFQSEKRRGTPRILVPVTDNPVLNSVEGSAPAFLAGMKVDRAARQAVQSKLDSILAKGSKIIAKSKNDYIVPSLYLMAKSFFYKEEWLASQIKCSELIDKDPVGKYSADAHLLLATNLLMQGKYDAGLTILSRTVDIAWLNERYDILTQAFNIEAEMALYYGDLEGAIRPYFQAIAQSDDRKQQAIWQNELAGILFRMKKYDRAERAYSKVLTFRTDLATEYEAKLYRASCLIRLGRDYEADRILVRLDEDGKFEEWKDYVATQRLIQTMLTGDSTKIKYTEFMYDSLHPQSQVMSAYHYEKGVIEFEKGNFVNARSYIAKSRTSRIQLISQPSNKIFMFMNQREIALKNIADTYQEVTKLELEKKEYEFEQQRLLEAMNNPDNDTTSEINTNDTTNDTIEKISETELVVVDTSENSDEPINKIDETDIVKIEPTNEIDTTDIIEIDTTKEEPRFDEQIDKQRIIASKYYYELARINHNIGNIDSANYYYKVAATIAPTTEPESARYLYVYAESVRDTNAWMADSILNVIATTQPKSEYGRITLKKLGYTEAFMADSITTVYNSAYNLMKHKEYDYAKEKFIYIYENYPDSLKYAPKSLYVLGFMYENDMQNFDSASKYYDILIEKYPNSEYAQELSLAMRYKTLVDNNSDIPDELKTREVELYTADTSILSSPYDSTLLSKPKKDGFSFDDLKNPSKLLEKTKKKIQEQIDKASEMVSDPEEKLKEGLEGLKEGVKVPKFEDFLPKSDENPPPDEEESEEESKENPEGE